MRILVAEDAKDLNRLIVKTLAKAGYSVDGCFNGEDALDYLNGDCTKEYILEHMDALCQDWLANGATVFSEVDRVYDAKETARLVEELVQEGRLERLEDGSVRLKDWENYRYGFLP